MKQTTIYIGPDIKGVVKKNEVFDYRPQKIVDQARRAYGPSENLFVPISKIVEKKAELRTQGSALALIYKNTEGRKRR